MVRTKRFLSSNKTASQYFLTETPIGVKHWFTNWPTNSTWIRIFAIAEMSGYSKWKQLTAFTVTELMRLTDSKACTHVAYNMMSHPPSNNLEKLFPQLSSHTLGHEV